jgi:hypothetical protein
MIVKQVGNSEMIPLLFLPEEFKAAKKNQLRISKSNYEAKITNCATIIKANIAKEDYVKTQLILTQILESLVDSFEISQEKWQNSNIEFDPSYFWKIRLLNPQNSSIADGKIIVNNSGEVFEEENSITIEKIKIIFLSDGDFAAIKSIGLNSIKSLVDIGIAEEEDFKGFQYVLHLNDYFNRLNSKSQPQLDLNCQQQLQLYNQEPISLTLSIYNKTHNKEYNFLLYPKADQKTDGQKLTFDLAQNNKVSLSEIIPQGNILSQQQLNFDDITRQKLAYQIDVLAINQVLATQDQEGR